jgi:hypothetical protein
MRKRRSDPFADVTVRLVERMNDFVIVYSAANMAAFKSVIKNQVHAEEIFERAVLIASRKPQPRSK